MAVVANRDKVLEVAAEVFQLGANFCNAQIANRKIKMACQMNDGEFADYESAEFGSEATTPSGSDDEQEENEDDEELYSCAGSEHYMRFDQSVTTLVGRTGEKLDVEDVD